VRPLASIALRSIRGPVLVAGTVVFWAGVLLVAATVQIDWTLASLRGER